MKKCGFPEWLCFIFIGASLWAIGYYYGALACAGVL